MTPVGGGAKLAYREGERLCLVASGRGAGECQQTARLVVSEPLTPNIKKGA